MPAKKTDEQIESSVIEKSDQKKRSLDSYARYKNLNKPMFYRMKYEIREDLKQKKTIDEWEKLYNRVKF